MRWTFVQVVVLQAFNRNVTTTTTIFPYVVPRRREETKVYHWQGCYLWIRSNAFETLHISYTESSLASNVDLSFSSCWRTVKCINANVSASSSHDVMQCRVVDILSDQYAHIDCHNQLCQEITRCGGRGNDSRRDSPVRYHSVQR